MSANSLIVVEIFLIVFSISRRENKIPRRGIKICLIGIEKTLVFLLQKTGIFSDRGQRF